MANMYRERVGRDLAADMKVIAGLVDPCDRLSYSVEDAMRGLEDSLDVLQLAVQEGDMEKVADIATGLFDALGVQAA